MVSYILRKFLHLIPMLFVISFLIYLGIELMPGDAVDFMISPDEMATVSAEALAQMRSTLGLDKPFPVRYFIWLGNLLRGDFGYSLQSGVAVSTLVMNTLPATLELSVAALLISTLAGSFLGVFSALRKNSIADNALSIAGMIGVAIPQFLFGLIAIIVFVFNLGWFPVGGRMAPGQEAFLQRFEYLVLPAIVLGLSMTAGVMRYSRASMLDSLNRDYVKTARSKGLPEWRVNLVHGFRVACTPVAVLIGFRLPMLIGGAVVIEQIFQWPGLGVMFLGAVRSQNTPIVMMVGFFSVLLVLLASIIVDILTAILDPRIKFN
ncbi:MAG: peptide ABC transporter permease [Spirochaetes bacterium RIFOXYC1_FULL_54_7]|nr:MAG: peptide ABC transporter permease [Spirochaetes bacterium RIFOXYC1_FULL_54_7]